jgi:hypothetical protein
MYLASFSRFPLELRKSKAPKGRVKNKRPSKPEPPKREEADHSESGEEFDAEKVVEDLDEEVEGVLSNNAKKKKKRDALKKSVPENAEEGQSLLEEMDRQFTGAARLAEEEKEVGEGLGKLDLDDIVGEMDEEVERRVAESGPDWGTSESVQEGGSGAEKGESSDQGGGGELSADALLGEMDEEIEERFQGEEEKASVKEGPKEGQEFAGPKGDAVSV